MIYKIMKGRLGNQMFQYAATKAFQKKYFPNEQILFDYTYVKKKGTEEEGFKNALTDFNTDVKECRNIRLTAVQKINLIILVTKITILKVFCKDKENFNKNRTKIEENKKQKLNKMGIFWRTNGYTKFNCNDCNSKNKVFYGFFESTKYFENIKEELQESFTPQYKELEKNKELYQIIQNEESVCISIRRGDFVTNPKYKKKHYICDEKYFQKGIEIVNKKLPNARYIVFSDDIEWVKKNMKFPKNTMFEDGTDPVWEKLRLMYNCKNFIISNSTFSWWAQYLSKNKNKIVIAPKKWFNDQENPDIYDEKWILI